MTSETHPQRKPRRRLFADIQPLRESPDYRRLWIGDALSGIGGQFTRVAVPVQVYALTHSSFAVGMLGLASAVPLLTFGLLGGAVADAVDRRKLALLMSCLMALVSCLFALQASLDLRQLWLLYALTALGAGFTAVSSPTRRAFVPRLLRRDLLRAANALSMLSFQVSMALGPLLAGVLIAVAGLKAAYILDALTFVFPVYAVARLRPMAMERVATGGLRMVAEGLRFVAHTPVVASALLVDLNATIFGMPFALFPALVATHFGGGARTIGLLYAAPALGGLICAAVSGSLAHIHRQGLAVLVAVAVWGAAIAGFGFSRAVPLAVLCLAVAGGADVVNGVFRGTILQSNTPDSLQGRVGSVGFIVGAGGPRVGDIEAGVVAAWTSPVTSAVSGGLISLAGAAALALALPAFIRYRATSEHAETSAQTAAV